LAEYWAPNRRLRRHLLAKPAQLVIAALGESRAETADERAKVGRRTSLWQCLRA